ncbi:PAS domain S-box protein, partial [Candidatus Poribacteria bacterium]|nr:PAS domain S-box protein [Candidatus Poribacteria bacterium]
MFLLTTVYFVAALIFLYLFSILRRQFFLFWTVAWIALVVRGLARILVEQGLAPAPGGGHMNEDLARWAEAVGGGFLFMGVAFALAGVYLFARRPYPLGALAAATAVVFAASVAGAILQLPLIQVSTINTVFIVAATGWTAFLFFRFAREFHPMAMGLLGGLFTLFTIHKAIYPVFHFDERLDAIRATAGIYANALELFMAVLALGLLTVVALEDVRADLSRSESRFRQFFEGASDPIYLVSPDTGEIEDVNPRGCEMLGYSREQLLAMSIQDLAAPEQGTSPAGLLSKLSRDSARDTIQTHHRDKSGKLIPVSVTRSAIEVGNRRFLLLHTRDISDLRHQERQLASRISQLQAIQRVSQVLTRTLNTDELCGQLYESIQGLFTLDYYSMDYLDDRQGRLENVTTVQMIGGAMTKIPSDIVGGGLAEAELRRMMKEKLARLVTRDDRAEEDGQEEFPQCCKSLVIVPMVAGDETVGLMTAGSMRSNAFGGSQLDVLQHIASIAGIALKNAQLYEFQQKQIRRQKFLADLGPALITNLDTLQAISLVGGHLKTFMDVSEIEVWLMSEDLSAGALYRAYPSGKPASIALPDTKATPSNVDIVQACHSSGIAIVENDCRNSRLIPQPWVSERQLKSCMAVPVLVGERVVGVMRLDDSRKYAKFRPDDTEFVKLVAQITATALEAARLFQQVRNSEQRFSQLIEASSVGIAILRDRMLEFANATFQEMLELSDTPINSLSLFELVPEEYQTQWRRAVEAVEEGRDHRFEGWMQRPDGNRLWCEVYLSNINYGGVRAVQLLVDDVTQKKAVLAQRQNDLRVRSIGTLTAGIGQDFQSLFSTILGHIGYLKLQGVESEGGERSLLAIEAAVMRALDFTRQLMAFAETSEGGMHLLDLNRLIIQAARLHEGILPDRPRMKFDLAANLPKVLGNE